MENSEYGTIVGTMSCRDDDNDELNSQIGIYSEWFPSTDYRNKTLIPFEIRTENNNTSEVIIFRKD